MSFVSGRAKALMLRRCKNTTLIKVDVCLAAFAKEFPGFFPLGSFSVIYLFPASPQIKSSFWQSWSTPRPRRDGRRAGGGVCIIWTRFSEPGKPAWSFHPGEGHAEVSFLFWWDQKADVLTIGGGCSCFPRQDHPPPIVNVGGSCCWR